MEQINKLDFTGQSIYVGLDVHKKSWAVSIFSEQCEHKKFTQPPQADKLAHYLKRNFPGATYQAVYEAGFSGFGAHDQLQERGVNCLVVHPADVPTTNKERTSKRDRTDCRKLARQSAQRRTERDLRADSSPVGRSQPGPNPANVGAEANAVQKSNQGLSAFLRTGAARRSRSKSVVQKVSPPTGGTPDGAVQRPSGPAELPRRTPATPETDRGCQSRHHPAFPGSGVSANGATIKDHPGSEHVDRHDPAHRTG